MRPYKVIVTIFLLMSIFTLFLVPMEAGVFPAWINTDMVQFMLVFLCVICAVILI